VLTAPTSNIFIDFVIMLLFWPSCQVGCLWYVCDGSARVICQ